MALIQKVTKKFEKKIITNPFLFKLYSLPYYYILKKEIKLAEITADDNVLNIGCGAAPFSAVYLAQISGAKVVGIDFDTTACKRGQKCVKSLDLEDKIKIEKGNGIKYDPAGFNVIHIALQAEPKKEILLNLFKNADDGTRIIVRHPREFFAEQYDTFLPTKHSIVDMVKLPMITFNKSFLYVKK